MIQVPAINETASFNLVVPPGQSFPPGSSIPFSNFFSNVIPPSNITFPGGLGSNTVHLAPGSYLINYAASIFNTSAVIKLVIYQDGLFVVSSFSGGPDAAGNAHTSGNALILVPPGGSNIQLRVDLLSGNVTPFSNITMVITTVGVVPAPTNDLILVTRNSAVNVDGETDFTFNNLRFNSNPATFSFTPESSQIIINTPGNYRADFRVSGRSTSASATSGLSLAVNVNDSIVGIPNAILTAPSTEDFREVVGFAAFQVTTVPTTVSILNSSSVPIALGPDQVDGDGNPNSRAQLIIQRLG